MVILCVLDAANMLTTISSGGLFHINGTVNTAGFPLDYKQINKTFPSSFLLFEVNLQSIFAVD